MGLSLRGLIRDTHLYLGLAASPFVVLYAASTLVLNHPGWAGGPGAPTKREVPVRLVGAETASSLDLGREVLRQAGVSGEIMSVQRRPEQNRLVVPVQRPGEKITVTVDLATGQAVIERTRTGFWSRLTFLHKMPGPHVVDLRGNWLPIALWRWLADASVCAVLLLAASGLYLWTGLRAERRTGLIALIAGAAVFGLLVAGIAL